MLTAFLVLYVTVLVSLPLYSIYVSLVLRRTWHHSKLRALLLLMAIPVMLGFLALPALPYLYA